MVSIAPIAPSHISFANDKLYILPNQTARIAHVAIDRHANGNFAIIASVAATDAAFNTLSLLSSQFVNLTFARDRSVICPTHDKYRTLRNIYLAWESYQNVLFCKLIKLLLIILNVLNLTVCICLNYSYSRLGHIN